MTRILIRHARDLRRVRYGKALLRMFIKKLSVALKSILRTSEGVADAPFLSTDLSVIRDETTGHLITAPEEVIAKITLMETVALCPDPTLPPGAPFPWLGHVHPTPSASTPMIYGCITPAIMKEALCRNPSHKAA